MCVRPTSPPNVNCDCDTDNVIDCYSTLNDWTDGSNGISSFINNRSRNSDIASLYCSEDKSIDIALSNVNSILNIIRL